MNTGLRSPRFWIVATSAALALTGCPANQSNGNNVVLPDADGVGGDGVPQPTPPSPWDTLTWSTSLIDSGGADKAAGTQGKMIRDAGGTLYYTYLKQVSTTPDCDIAVFGGGSAPMLHYDLRLATLASGASSWSVETVPVASPPLASPGYVNTRYGVDAAFDNSGNMVIAVAAGGAGLASCGSSDLVLAVRNGPGSWGVTSPVTDSSACCSQTCPTEAPGQECCIDPACTAGTDVGAWAAIARSSSGTVGVVYTDYHNFWDQDGQNYQGVEIYEGGVTGVRPWSGYGLYAALAYSGTAPIVAFTGYKSNGLQVLKRSSGTRFAPLSIATPFASYKIGERIQLLVASDGTLGLAFHVAENSAAQKLNQLYYCSSSDGGTTWSQCAIVDTGVGGYPALAFDNNNHPALSYYYCGSDATCSVAVDHPRFAWRDDNQKWWYFDFYNESTIGAGKYTALGFDKTTNAPVVGFQDLTRGAAVVAQGKFGN